jgi:trimethylamine--corrinoid protein Co-methyltransferase
MEPRTGRWGGGGPEHSLLGAATTEMARSYGLPATASTGGSDEFVTGIQATYERALNWALPALSWPDILIGPGSLGGASTLCLEQMVIDVEVYRMCRRMRAGIGDGIGEADVAAALDEVGPVGDFLSRTATRDAVRGGELFLPRLGHHGTFDRWDATGRPDILAQARSVADAAIAGHQPIPFPEEVAAELATLERRARDELAGAAGSVREVGFGAR